MKYHLCTSTLALVLAAPVSASSCSSAQAEAAAKVVDQLQSWSSVYHYFRRYRHCHDGGIAGTAEEKIQDLWAEQWHSLPAMLIYTKQDPRFKAFLWRALESDAFSREKFSKVRLSADQNCPKGGRSFCGAVARVARGYGV